MSRALEYQGDGGFPYLAGLFWRIEGPSIEELGAQPWGREPSESGRAPCLDTEGHSGTLSGSRPPAGPEGSASSLTELARNLSSVVSQLRSVHMWLRTHEPQAESVSFLFPLTLIARLILKPHVSFC